MARKTAKTTRKTAAAKKAKGQQAQKAPQADAGDAREIIDMNQAMEILKTTRPTFSRWLRAGKVKGFKVGRQWRFYRDDVERFMKGEEPQFELTADLTPLVETLAKRLRELGAGTSPPADASEVQYAVDLMVQLAGALRASDIHLAPHFKEGGSTIAVLRYRVDGVLQPTAEIDIRLLRPLVEEWKKRAACNVQERLKPQDGRTLAEIGETGKKLDLRVCFLPTNLGESLTARILDSDAIRLTLDQIDYSARDKEKLREWLHAPWGTVIVTGPTGSGKTTALYSCINELAKPELKIVSIEDPIEFYLPWVVQTQIRPSAGVTFPVALRAVLRSDPDVVLFGEIRDLESLTISQQCTLAGHLVLTTIHADEATRALMRLVEMGSEPFLVGDATKLIVAQRLVRILCRHCSKECEPSENDLRLAERLARTGGVDWTALKKEFRAPVGCPKCGNSGYRGRNVIAEALEVTPEIQDALKRSASVDELRTIAVGQGMVTMAAHGVQRAAGGSTSLDEVIRVLAVR